MSLLRMRVRSAACVGSLLALVACGHQTMRFGVSGGAAGGLNGSGGGNDGGGGAQRSAFAISEGAAVSSVVAPVSLTAGDGTALSVESLGADIHVHGPLALTKVRVSFRNPTNTVLEGRFRITLPPRSSLARLAMKINGEWREADAAESGIARETYEEILHRRRDPLLVEQRREREISARVFPINGFEVKEIALSYTSEIGPDAPITFPLRGLPVVGQLDVSVIDGSTEPFALHLSNERPSTNVSYRINNANANAGGNDSITIASRSDNLVAMRVPSNVPLDPDPIRSPIVFLVETSAAKGGPDFEATANLLTSIARAAAPSKAHAVVVAYDQSTERLFDGEIGSMVTSLPTTLAARGALGASDLDRGLTAALVEVKRVHATRVVIVGGGAPSVGSSDPKHLRSDITALENAGVTRVDVLGTSAVADLRVYKPFARQGVVIDDAPAEDTYEHGSIFKRLTAHVAAANIPVSVEGATWTSTSSFDAASFNESRVVLAAFKDPAQAHADVRVHVGARVMTLAAAKKSINSSASSSDSKTPRELIEHAIGAAKLEQLVARGETTGFDDPLKREIITLARKNRLASPFTSLIVLENESDRATLHSREAARESAGTPRPPTPPPPPPPAPTATAGAKAGASAHVARTPMMRQAATVQVNGRVPPEVIQRIVRQNWGRFRACYEDGLRRRADLAGRVSVRFVIARDGVSQGASDGGSDLADPATVACIIKSFNGLSFPMPEGGIITVVYPIMFSPLAAGEVEEQKRTLETRPMPRSAPTQSPFALPAPPVPGETLFPWSPDYTNVMALLPKSVGGSAAPAAPAVTSADANAAIKKASDLRARDNSAIALTALGVSYEAAGDLDRAARAYGSLADIYPERAEMLRAAAIRIDRIRPGDPIAIDLLKRAVIDRPDQPSSHHLLCMTLLRAGKPEAAFEAAAAAISKQRHYESRFVSGTELLGIDLGLAAAAWMRAAEPSRRATIQTRASLLGARVQDRPTLHAVASWETDTSDIDVLAVDVDDRSSSYSSSAYSHDQIGLPVANSMDGFGPDAIEIPIAKAASAGTGGALTPQSPPHAMVRLERRGTGGDVLGVVHVIKHDGRGDVSVEPRPFTIMNAKTVLDLGAL